jgi:cytochrome c oxidase assembly factor CtaG
MIDNTTAADLFTQRDIPWIVASELALAALIYALGWARIRRTRPFLFPIWRLATFLGGIVAQFVAVISLSVHYAIDEIPHPNQPSNFKRR